MAAAAAASTITVPQSQLSPSFRKPITDRDPGMSAEEEATLERAAKEQPEQEAERTVGLYTQKRGVRGKVKKKPWYIIDPRTSRFMPYWDGISMSALIFTAIVTFVEVAFVSASGKVDWLFTVNRLVDLVFTMDVVLNFLLMYPHVGSSPTDSVRWVHTPSKIRRRYLRSWFCLDVFSIGVSGFDFLTLDAVTGGNGNNSASSLKALRIVRVARLIKLVRLARSSSILKRLEARMTINYGMLALVKTMVGLLLASHWYACIWGLITTFERPDKTWYYEFGYCVFEPPAGYAALAASAAQGNMAAAAVADSQLADEANYACVGPFERYIASLYWAIMTITSIGYGDIAAAPNNAYEQAWCTLLMLLGGMIWGAVIATFCGVIASMDPQGTEFRKTMDDLNSFMKSQGLPGEMRMRLREYFHQTKHLQVARANKGLIESMSPMLQEQVVWKINERWLRHVWFLRAAEDKFMVQLSLTLEAAVFAPAELCPSGYMYIAHRGIALYGGRVMTSGKVWGEDIILTSPHLRSPYAARCMTYVEVYLISREDLIALASRFPATLRLIRRSAYRLAFRREMIRRAEQSLDKAEPTAAERMLISISTREPKRAVPLQTALQGRDSAAAPLPAEAASAAHTSTPLVAGTPTASVDAHALAALEARLNEQHHAVLKRLETLAARIDELKAA